jgi:hypothetical protein
MKLAVYLDAEDWRATLTKLEAALKSTSLTDNAVWVVGRDRLEYIISVIQARLERAKK